MFSQAGFFGINIWERGVSRSESLRNKEFLALHPCFVGNLCLWEMDSIPQVRCSLWQGPSCYLPLAFLVRLVGIKALLIQALLMVGVGGRGQWVEGLCQCPPLILFQETLTCSLG